MFRNLWLKNLQLRILNLLNKNGHVRRSSDCYSLTNSGRVLRSELVYNEVRYWITTGIAVAAALKAYLL